MLPHGDRKFQIDETFNKHPQSSNPRFLPATLINFAHLYDLQTSNQEPHSHPYTAKITDKPVRYRAHVYLCHAAFTPLYRCRKRQRRCCRRSHPFFRGRKKPLRDVSPQNYKYAALQYICVYLCDCICQSF